jgi:dihydrofolate reductase
VVHSIGDALFAAGDDPEVFIIGGAELYAQTLARAHRLYLTEIHAHVSGDTYFPNFDMNAWREQAREKQEADATHPFAYSFVTLERIT